MNILLIEFEHLGDTLLLIPTISFLRECCSGSRIGMIVRPSCEDPAEIVPTIKRQLVGLEMSEYTGWRTENIQNWVDPCRDTSGEEGLECLRKKLKGSIHVDHISTCRSFTVAGKNRLLKMLYKPCNYGLFLDIKRANMPSSNNTRAMVMAKTVHPADILAAWATTRSQLEQL
jgi:hypothetical protein